MISAAESMSKKGQRNGKCVLKGHTEFYSDERDLREHLERDLNKLFLVKIQFGGCILV